jgi:uncharacterized membrane protein
MNLRSYRWDAVSGAVELPLLAGTTGSIVGGMNAAGQISGQSGDHAVVWNRDNSIRDLGLGTAGAINNLGQVVGDLELQAALWNPDGSVIYLPALPGGDGSWACAISDQGQIVGAACDGSGRPHAVLWTLVPEPSSLLALLAGFGGFGVMLRKRYV